MRVTGCSCLVFFRVICPLPSSEEQRSATVQALQENRHVSFGARPGLSGFLVVVLDDFLFRPVVLTNCVDYDVLVFVCEFRHYVFSLCVCCVTCSRETLQTGCNRVHFSPENFRFLRLWSSCVWTVENSTWFVCECNVCMSVCVVCEHDDETLLTTCHAFCLAPRRTLGAAVGPLTKKPARSVALSGALCGRT